MALAWAIVEHLHERTGARALFATHYHELTDLPAQWPRVRNVHSAAREWQDKVIFLRKLLDGPAERSYGIQVARLAGLPPSVLERAAAVLSVLESSAASDGEPGQPKPHRRRKAVAGPQLGLFEGSAAPAAGTSPTSEELHAQRVLRELGALDVNHLTPLQALNLLAGWKGELKR